MTYVALLRLDGFCTVYADVEANSIAEAREYFIKYLENRERNESDIISLEKYSRKYQMYI